MRFLFLIVFTLTVLLQSLQGFFTIVNWKINQAELTAKYCVNKAKPMLKCNGKCYLAKQLQKAEDELNEKKSKQEQSKNTIKLMEGSAFIVPQTIVFASNFSFQIESTICVSKSKNLLPGANYPIFHPPCLA